MKQECGTCKFFEYETGPTGRKRKKEPGYCRWTLHEVKDHLPISKADFNHIITRRIMPCTTGCPAWSGAAMEGAKQ